MKTTHLVHIHDNPEPVLKDTSHIHWTPWLNCTDADNTSCMAMHQHLRMRGGVDGPTIFHVYVAETEGNLHANGRPMSCHISTYEVDR